MLSNSKLAIAACAFELNTDGTLRILPAGEFRARDGRPKDVGAWRMSGEIASRVISAMAARKDAMVIDYEHQTLYTEKNGSPAPAAGWMSAAMQWREGDGLYATVEWTDRAKAAIAAKEYRYFSPVFSYDKKTGEIAAVMMGAITNNPGLDGLTDLTARAAARFDATFNDEENAMNKQLLTLLGLKEDATEAQAIDALTALKAKADTAQTEIAALRATQADPSKFVPVDVVTKLQTQVAELSTKAVERDVNDMVTAAMTAGKILPALETWARELGKTDIAKLKAFIDAAQPIAALNGTQTNGVAPDGSGNSGKPIEERCKAEYESSAALRSEFVTLADYTAFKRADEAGQYRSMTGRNK